MHQMKLMALLLGVITVAVLLPTVHAMPSASASIQRSNGSYVDAAGYYHVVGEVRNTGAVWLEFIKITGSLRNRVGSLIDVQFTYASATKLPPGELSPFDLIELDTAKSSQITGYNLTLEYQATAPIPVNLAVLNVTPWTNSLRLLELVGEVQNNGQDISSFTQVIGTFYLSCSYCSSALMGQVVYVGSAYTSPNQIMPGMKQSFKITVSDAAQSSKSSSWRIFAQSRDYTSVPEFPWPRILTIAALTLGVVITRSSFTRVSKLKANAASP